MIKMNSIIIILFCIFIQVADTLGQDFNLEAVSSDPTKGPFILLSWPYQSGIKGYNIYRKESKNDAYPPQPINNKLITPMTDCNEIKAIIAPNSEEWKMLENALSTTTKKNTIQKFNPCNIASITEKDTIRFPRLQMLTGLYYQIAQVIGQAYIDESLSTGTTYWYEIRSVKKGQTKEIVLDSIEVVAGFVIQIPKLSVTADSGDSQVLLTWKKATLGSPVRFDIERQLLLKSKKTNILSINDSSAVTLYYNKLNGDTLVPPLNGFLDFQRWDSLTGDPVPHLVNGIQVNGPKNGNTYKYRVKGVDKLDQAGIWSNWVKATPFDSTPPAVPANVTVTAYEDTLEIRWFKVTRDEKGHPETKIKGYWVWRSKFPEKDGIRIGDFVKHPSDTSDSSVTYVIQRDGSPDLRPPYGVQNYWYKVRCIDKAGNKSQFSAAVAGHLDDITPPAAPDFYDAIGDTNFIFLAWNRNGEEDLAGYMIYRGVCGSESVFIEGDFQGYKKYPQELIANIDNPDSITFIDFNVPQTAPICWGYSIKAYDKSQNLSDSSITLCARIKEKTPPPPPVISGLKARSGAIQIEWISPPVQDLFGFIVERSETGSDSWIQINPLLDFPEEVDCTDIPAVNKEAEDSIYTFLDTTVVKKEIYWYRIKGADFGGSISDPSAPVETYTFDFDGPPKPVITSINPVSGQKGLEIKWDPVYISEYKGFVIFRSLNKESAYRQISPFVKENTYIDDRVVSGKTYWYKIQYFSINGNRSLISSPESGSTK
jgi:hypothetical protein